MVTQRSIYLAKIVLFQGPGRSLQTIESQFSQVFCVKHRFSEICSNNFFVSKLAKNLQHLGEGDRPDAPNLAGWQNCLAAFGIL